MNEITFYNQMTNPLDAVDRLGVMMAKSGMFGCENENAGKVLAMICMAEKKSPVEIMRQYDIIGGKLRKKALASYAEFRAKGGIVRWINTGEDGKEARADFTFEGQTITCGYTIDQAIKGGATMKDGSNWKKTPGNMLRARCLSNAIAMLAPEIFAGGDDSEADDTPAAEIKLPAATITTSPPPATAASTVPGKVIEAEVIKSSPGPAKPPSVPPTASDTAGAAVSEAVAMPAQSPAPASQPAAALLSPEIVAKLEAAIGEHAVAAGKWLLKEGWLKPGQGLDSLAEGRANNIIKNTARFIRAINTPKTPVIPAK